MILKKKWIVFLLLVLVLGITGCKKDSKDTLINKMVEFNTNLKEYTVDANMDIVREETTVKFDVQVSYLQPNYFKVILKNQESNHLQAIVKNDDGVYVLTPSLNKQFKFTSDWPLNSSHTYLLQSLMKDIANDENRVVTVLDNTVEVKVAVEHRTNASLKTQKIVFDKKTYQILSATVYNEQDLPIIQVTFKNFNAKPGLKKTEFIVEKINSTLQLELSEGATVTDINGCIPTYVPEGAELSQTSKKETYRIDIYKGEVNYTIACMTVEDVGISGVTRFYGEPVLLDSGIGALNETSLTFYYGSVMVIIFANDMEPAQFVAIANSFRQNVAS